jgi:hypothetical protein
MVCIIPTKLDLNQHYTYYIIYRTGHMSNISRLMTERDAIAKAIEAIEAIERGVDPC